MCDNSRAVIKAPFFTCNRTNAPPDAPMTLRAVDAARAVFGGDAVAYSPRLYILLIAQKKLAQAAIRRNGQLYREAGLFFFSFFLVLTDRSICGK